MKKSNKVEMNVSEISDEWRKIKCHHSLGEK